VINTSTIFAIQSDDQRNSIVLHMIDVTYQKDLVPTGESFQATDQHVPLDVQYGCETLLTSDIPYTTEQFKRCAGKGCSAEGIHYLSVRFIKKCGWFCDSCKTNLIDENLVTNDPAGVALKSGSNP